MACEDSTIQLVYLSKLAQSAEEKVGKSKIARLSIIHIFFISKPFSNSPGLFSYPVEERIATTRKDNASNKGRESSNTLPKGKSACSEEEDRDIPIHRGA